MIEPVKRQVAGQIQLAEVKVGCARIGVHLKRVVRRAEEARDLTGKLHDVVHHVRQRDERGEAPAFRARSALRIAP